MRRIFTPSVLWGIIVVQSAAIVILLVPVQSYPNQWASIQKAARIPSARAPEKRGPDSETSTVKGRRHFGAPTDQEWLKIASTLDPVKARELLSRNARETTNLEERAEKTWHIINQLCRNGYTKEAWGLIESADGEVRRKGIGGFFRDADLSDEEMIAMLDKLKTEDRSAGLYGYWSRLSPEEFARLPMSRFPLRSPPEQAAFERTINDLLKECYSPENPSAGRSARSAVLERVIAQTNAGQVSYWMVANILKNDPSRDGFLYWELVKHVSPGAKKGQRTFDGTEAQIIRVMTAQDPERTLALASTPGTREYPHFHIAMTEWLIKDFAAGEAWYQRNENRLSPIDLDRAAVAFVRASVRAGNHDIGEQWAAKIRSEDWKKTVAYEMNAIERRKAK